MARNVYPVSIDVNLLKTKKELYKLKDDYPIATNVFLAYYQNQAGESSGSSGSSSNQLPVVIKRFKVDNLDTTDLELAFHEAKILRHLKHQSIVPLLANFVTGNQIWFVYPVAEYGSCYQLSRPFGMTEQPIAHIVRDVLEGVDYLHSRKIIHRGIRSSRVLVGSNGRCVLTGLRHAVSLINDCKLMSVMHDYPLTAECNVNWYSPEMLEQNLCGYDYSSDIYSVGIMICELANGVVPFEPLAPTEILLDKLTGHMPCLFDEACSKLADIDSTVLEREGSLRFQVYRSRQFSPLLHQMLLQCCLNSDPWQRYSAKKLLKHKFFKQIDKSSNLLNFLPNKSLLQERLVMGPDGARPERCRCLDCMNCKFNGYIDKKFLQDDELNDEIVEWNF